MDERVGFLGLLGQTVVLGLAAAFTPMLLALQVVIVSGDPWRRRAFAVAAGGGLAFVLVGALLLLGFAQLPTPAVGDDPTGAWLRIVAGLALVGFAVVLFRPHPELSKRVESDIRGYVARASTWVFFGVAFALSIKDVSSFIVLAPALHDIAVADVSAPMQVLLVVVLYGLALSPVLAPPTVRLAFGHRADVGFARLYRFTLDHQFQLVGGMAAVVAVFLVVTGIARLLEGWSLSS